MAKSRVLLDLIERSHDDFAALTVARVNLAEARHELPHDEGRCDVCTANVRYAERAAKKSKRALLEHLGLA